MRWRSRRPEFARLKAGRMRACALLIPSRKGPQVEVSKAASYTDNGARFVEMAGIGAQPHSA